MCITKKAMIDRADKKINEFFKQFPKHDYSRGEVVIRSGGPIDHFFFIETGAVKMMTTSREGQNLVLHIFYPESCFPLLSLIQTGINKYDFMTITDTVVRRIPQTQFVSFLQENNDVLYAFFLRSLRGLQGLLNRIEQSTFISAQSQVASLLLYFAHHFSPNSSETQKTIEVRITHQDIAEWLGLSRENVSIQMKKLEREGLIRKHGKLVEIMDVQKLKQIVDVDTISQ
jgi:CRP/FNR family transcriptional regulator, cyclic AMP receptor protein